MRSPKDASGKILLKIQSGKKVLGSPLSPHARLFMLIHLCHALNNDYVSETIIMNFWKYNHRIKEMVLNLSRSQSTVSTIDGEKGTKIPH
jgi:hypothetical protein